MKKPLAIALVGAAVAGIATVLVIQYQSIMQPAQEMDEGVRKIEQANCNIDRINKVPETARCKELLDGKP